MAKINKAFIHKFSQSCEGRYTSLYGLNSKYHRHESRHETSTNNMGPRNEMGDFSLISHFGRSNELYNNNNLI